ncbi:MAG TPA: ABC transporter substrate-binding protein [bacterium]|nr:ABC transporter substrate-binding protein [bacterium]
MKRVLIGAAILLVIVSCGQKENVVKLGLVAPLTGDVKTFGESTKNGFTIAVDEANAKGGINGKQIKVYISDDKNDPTEASNAGSKLINQDGVRLLIGSVSSKCSIPLSELCETMGAVMITPTSTNPKVTIRDDGSRKAMVFRACFIDPFQGAVAAKFALDNLKAKTSAILYDVGNDYVKGLAEFYRDNFTKGGGTIVAYESYAKDDADFSAILTKVKKENPDILYVPDYYNKVALIAKQARQLGIKSVMMGGDGWDSPDMIKIAGDAIEGGYFTNHYSPDDPRPEVQEWVKKYSARFGAKPDALATLAYDATSLMIAAATKAGSDDPAKVRDALQSLQLKAVSGSVTFDSSGNPIKSAAILRYTRTGQEYVATVTP